MGNFSRRVRPRANHPAPQPPAPEGRGADRAPFAKGQGAKVKDEERSIRVWLRSAYRPGFIPRADRISEAVRTIEPISDLKNS